MTNDLDRERARFERWAAEAFPSIWAKRDDNMECRVRIDYALFGWQAAIAAAQSDESERDMSGDGQGTTLHKVNSGIPAVAAHPSPAQCAQEQRPSDLVANLRGLAMTATAVRDARAPHLSDLKEIATAAAAICPHAADQLESAQCAPAQPVATVTRRTGTNPILDCTPEFDLLPVGAKLYAHPLPPPVPQQELFAWEATTPAYKKFITQTKYLKLSPLARNFYKPLRCANCVGDDS